MRKVIKVEENASRKAQAYREAYLHLSTRVDQIMEELEQVRDEAEDILNELDPTVAEPLPWD